MVFAGLNIIAVMVAAAAGLAVGALWYGVLSKAWRSALSKDRAARSASPMAVITAIIANLVMAFMLAGVIGHLGDVTIRNGVVSGAFIWIGFVMTSIAADHAFQGRPPELTAIAGGHWLAVLLVMGAVIGAFGA